MGCGLFVDYYFIIIIVVFWFIEVGLMVNLCMIMLKFGVFFCRNNLIFIVFVLDLWIGIFVKMLLLSLKCFGVLFVKEMNIVLY